jgi:hypothetical protein
MFGSKVCRLSKKEVWDMIIDYDLNYKKVLLSKVLLSKNGFGWIQQTKMNANVVMDNETRPGTDSTSSQKENHEMMTINEQGT